MMAGLLLIQPVLWRGLGGLQDRPSTLSALFFSRGKKNALGGHCDPIDPFFWRPHLSVQLAAEGCCNPCNLESTLSPEA